MSGLESKQSELSVQKAKANTILIYLESEQSELSQRWIYVWEDLNEILTSVCEKQKRTLRVGVVESIYLYWMKTKSDEQEIYVSVCEQKVERLQGALYEAAIQSVGE